MLYRKIETDIYQHFTSGSDKILMLTGARQTGKSFIINHVASKIFKNVVEINHIEDYDTDRLFESVSSVEEFHLRLSSVAGERLGSKEDTLVFLDEIQQYPRLLTLLKFLR
ncbi:MAG: AAA family ATPase, partial [Barnesiella sp.]|nr:AAA family ATPase [Barnesiella sp.]